jgi:isopenicillin N synthase-like dioxygenase
MVDPAELNVPTIDLLHNHLSDDEEDEIVEQIAKACSEYGFFQIINHGIPSELMDGYLEQCRLYFALPHHVKLGWKRNEGNARGYFDDELTKQKRDWKECLDVGVPGTRDWSLPDDDPSNRCLDGWNQFPPPDVLPDFRTTVTVYFDACARLADRVAILMAKGLGQDGDSSPMIRELRDQHSSYLRSNHYPPCDVGPSSAVGTGTTTPLGISPHRDAGFLTVLLQDVDCHSLQVEKDGQWVTVSPADRHALTINTGDMAQIWSNGRYRAPLHRVLSNETKERYSSPFFYNPSYQTRVRPLENIHLPHGGEREGGPPDDVADYTECLWGYFRAVRFAGDLTDLGVEIQVEDYLYSTNSPHVKMQEIFAMEADFSSPFSVDKYRPLLLQSDVPTSYLDLFESSQ